MFTLKFFLIVYLIFTSQRLIYNQWQNETKMWHVLNVVMPMLVYMYITK